jgi:hypothetical protein
VADRGPDTPGRPLSYSQIRLPRMRIIGSPLIRSNLAALVLGEFVGQPPGLAGPASAAHQVSDKLFNERAATHPEPDQAFPLLIAVRLTSRSARMASSAPTGRDPSSARELLRPETAILPGHTRFGQVRKSLQQA